MALIPTFVTTDPRSGGGLVRPRGSLALYVTGGAITPLYKFSTSDTDWCEIPQGGAATPVTADPRTGGGLAGDVGTIVMYVSGGVGVRLRKYDTGATDWATTPVISGGAGGTLTDGNKTDITVSAAGATWLINTGAVSTTELGGDITTAGKALLDDATAADQRTTLGLGTAATTASTAYEASGAVATHAALTTVHGISAFGATLVDDADAATSRTTLGLATVASSASAADLSAGTLPAARLPALTGDVVTSIGTVATSIAAGAVDTSKMGGDVTANAKAILTWATTADQRIALGAAPTVHTHAAADITSGTVDTARLGSGTANATTFLRGDQTWAAPSGGSDPWTYVVLGSDFTISTTANNNVTGLAFAPGASSTYVVEGFFMLRTATTTTGARPGMSWPSGTTDGASRIVASNSATASAFGNRGTGATFNAASTGLPNTTESWPATLWATVVTGGSPSGNVQVTLASETAAVNVTMRRGSWIRYRTI